MKSFKDMESIVKAKHNEIKSKDIDYLYGKPNDNAVYKAYNELELSPREKLARYLETTKVPKYVRLAKFLIELKTTNLELEKAKVLLKDTQNMSGVRHNKVKTTYKEFKQIDKRAKKVDRKNAAKLNKYKDIKKFMKYNLRIVLYKLETEVIDGYSVSNLTEFFDNCEELRFLNHSKLTKNVR